MSRWHDVARGLSSHLDAPVRPCAADVLRVPGVAGAKGDPSSAGSVGRCGIRDVRPDRLTRRVALFLREPEKGCMIRFAGAD